jgi:nitric oxide reductase large subunit
MASGLAFTLVSVWPPSWRWQGQVTLAAAGAMAVGGVLGGGAYMADDKDARTQHWLHAMGLLRLPEQH